MNKTRKNKTISFITRIKNRFGEPKSFDSQSTNLEHTNDGFGAIEHDQTPYYSPGLTNILFLSNRGLSRAPLAREVIRSLLHLSDHFGSVRPSARGISDAYDLCSFDKRMVQTARKFGYELMGNSRKVNMAELSSANLIIPLDEETEKFVNSRTFYINGQVCPIAMFLQADAHPYIPDPFAREAFLSTTANYEQIIRSVEYSCGKLMLYLPSLV